MTADTYVHIVSITIIVFSVTLLTGLLVALAIAKSKKK